jgi:hypothetical protein
MDDGEERVMEPGGRSTHRPATTRGSWATSYVSLHFLGAGDYAT